jgi:hypothetical protein
MWNYMFFRQNKDKFPIIKKAESLGTKKGQ